MKIFKILYYVFLALIAAIAILLIVSVIPVPGNIKFMVVLSGSMEPQIKTGSVVMTKPASNYNVGDIITFGPYSKTKAPTTHRITEVKGDVYITKGDANNAPDARQISQKDIIGKVMFDVPYLGYVVSFVRKPLGFLLILIIPALVIVFDEIKKIIGEVKKIKKAKKVS
jgi:signal peptidase